MSDVPAAAFYSLAVALLLRSSPGAAGAAGGVAFLIRPALLPAVAALLLVILARREQRTAFVPFTAALALFVAAQAGIQWHLYGSPLASGYGANLFGLSNLLANVRSYGEWIPKTHGLIWFIGGAIGLLAIRSLQAYAAIVATLIGAVVPYAVYRTFDHWETQRFILPFLIACTLTAVAGLFHISQRWLPRAGAWIALALTTGMIFGWTRWLDQQRVLQLALSEERYSQAAQLVDRVTPGNAVVLTSLHSGSIRDYARRDTLDWAKIPPDKLELTVTALREHARPVYVLLDGEEERTEFVARHGVVPMQRWLPAGQRRNVRLYEVRSEK
jgi:hypothetical protein